MTEHPKKPRFKGIDISKLSRVRPTKVPSVWLLKQVRKQRTDYQKLAMHAGLLLLIILISYSASLIGEFVFNDRFVDRFLAVKLTEESFWSSLVMKAISQPLSQSWLTSSFASDLENFMFDPAWYHMMNIVFHFSCCCYFYIFVYTLARYFWQDDGGSEPVHEVALVAAALLACHPLAAEAVAHIVGRQATLLGCNFFLTLNFFLWAFLTTNIRLMLRNYLLTFLFLLQAVFCGPQALAIPAVMLVIALLVKPVNLTMPHWVRYKWGEFIVIVMLLLLMPAIASFGFSADYSNGSVSPLPSGQVYAASQFHSLLAYYLRCFVLPIGLSIFPPYSTASNFADPITILGILVFGAGAFAAYKLRKQPMAAIGLALALLSILPSMFFKQNEITADWRFYLPIAGLSVAIAALLKPQLITWQTNSKIKVVALVLFGLLMAGTILRCLDFRSDITLFKSALKVNGQDNLAKAMLGLALVRAHKETQGVELAEQALKVDENCQPAYYALSLAYTPNKAAAADYKKNLLKVKTYLKKAYSLAVSQHLSTLAVYESERDLANILNDLGEYKEAKEFTEKALKINPNSVSLNLAMGKIFNASGEYIRALVYLNKVFVRDKSNPEVVEPLLEAELGLGTPQTLSAAYNTAKVGVVVNPTPQLRRYFVQAALSTGHLNESLQHLRMVMRDEDKDPRALYLASYVMLAAGQHKVASELKQKALAADPDIAKKMKIVGLNTNTNLVVPIEDIYPLAGAKQ